MRGCIPGYCALFALFAAPADACSVAPCQGVATDWFAPSPGETIPANAAALAVALWNLGPPALPEVVLTAGGASPLPITLAFDAWDPQVALAHLDAPLTPGLAVTVTATGCVAATPWQGSFVVGPAAAAPTSAGVLAVTVQVETVTVPVTTGACSGQITGPTARLQWTPDPTLLPWLPLTQVVVRVDGKEWARTPYGPAGGKLMRKPWQFFEFDPQVVVTRCSDEPVNPPSMARPWPGQGKHTIELTVHVAGMAWALAPLTAEVALSCASSPTGADALGGADVVQGQAPPRETPANSGCNAGPQAGAGWLAALVVLGLALRRRRARWLSRVTLVCIGSSAFLACATESEPAALSDASTADAGDVVGDAAAVSDGGLKPDGKPDAGQPDAYHVDDWHYPDSFNSPKCKENSCGDGDPCTQDLCDFASGCYHLPAADGISCTGTGGCAVGNTCQGGQCGSAAIGIANLGPGWSGHAATMSDGGFVIGGGRLLKPPDGELWLARYNANLEQQWQVKWNPGPGNDAMVAVRRLASGDLVAVGNSTASGAVPNQNQTRPWLARVTADGKQVWQIEVPTLDMAHCVTAVAVGDDGMALLAHGWLPTPVSVAFVNGSGVVTQTTELGIGKDLMAIAMATDSTASVDVLGYAKNAKGEPAQNRIWRVAQGTGVQWSVDFTVPGWHEAHRLAMAEGNAWWVVGWAKSTGTQANTMAVARVGHDGVTQWQRAFPSVGYRTVRSLLTQADGSLVLLANHWFTKEPPMLLELTPSGSTAWLQKTALTTSLPDDLIATPSGFAWTEITPGGDLHLVRADHFGHTSCASAGTCWNLPATACQDGDPCTTNECTAQANKACFNGKNAVCDDHSACTLDACDLASGCTWTDLAGPCDDGDACTEGDACAGGLCGSIGAVPCDDGKPCTVDSCMTKGGCLHMPGNDGAPCDDGNTCTTGDVCAGGGCGKPKLWQQDLFGGEARTAVALWPDDEGGLTIVGDVTASDQKAAARVAHLSTLGQIAWQQTSSAQSGLQVSGAVRTGSGAIWAVGAVAGDPWLAAWTAAGVPLWSKTLSSSAIDGAEAATPTSTGVAVCGLDASAGAWWASFDAGGVQLLKTTIGTAQATAIGAVLGMANGDAVAAVHAPSAVTPEPLTVTTLVRIDSSGKVLWAKTLGEGFGLRVFGLAAAAEGIMAAGSMGMGAEFGNSVALLTAGADGQSPPTVYGMAGPGGNGHGIAPLAGNWLIGERHVPKQGNGKGLALVATSAGKMIQQVDLLSDVSGDRVLVLARPDGWDALAQVKPNGAAAWRVVRADALGKTLCP